MDDLETELLLALESQPAGNCEVWNNAKIDLGKSEGAVGQGAGNPMQRASDSALRSARSKKSPRVSDATYDWGIQPSCTPHEPSLTTQSSNRTLRTSRSSALLGSLSDSCLLRILSSLSPEDLCAIGQTSRHFKHAASEPSIWKALYLSRWPKGPSDIEQRSLYVGLPNSWKALYMQRDLVEVEEQMAQAPENLRDFFIAMATARRSEPLSPAEASGVVGRFAGTDLSDRVAAFRRNHGIRPPSEPPDTDPNLGQEAPHARPLRCPGGCQFVDLGNNYWICEKGGHVHACGEACGERGPGAADGMCVCRITGRCFQQMLADDDNTSTGGGERGDMGPGDGEDPGGGDWNAEEGMGGRLGRAFYAGYNAVDEREMLLRFGVRM